LDKRRERGGVIGVARAATLASMLLLLHGFRLLFIQFDRRPYALITLTSGDMGFGKERVT